MRRGWILLLTIVVVLLGSGFTWWWSTPGQVWWLQFKADRYIPPLVDRPGGWDNGVAEFAVEDFLEPQVSRLIARDFVRWYARRIPGGKSDDQLQRLRSRIDREISVPHPFSWLCDQRMLDPWQDGGEILVFKLLPPDQHAVLARICREELGTEGEVITVDKQIVVPWDLLTNLVR